MWLILACRLVFSHRARMMLTANLSVQDRMANGTVIPNVFANHGPIETYFLHSSSFHSKVHKAGYSRLPTACIVCVTPLPCGQRSTPIDWPPSLVANC